LVLVNSAGFDVSIAGAACVRIGAHRAPYQDVF
jgi:hypothetical protein